MASRWWMRSLAVAGGAAALVAVGSLWLVAPAVSAEAPPVVPRLACPSHPEQTKFYSRSDTAFDWGGPGSASQIFDSAALAGGVGLSGERLVWGTWRYLEGSRIFTWTAAEGASLLLETEGDVSASFLSGDRVVWVEADAGGARSIFTWTPEGGVARVAGTRTFQVGVSGDRLVWAERVEGSGNEVFTWTPAGGVVRLTRNNVSDDGPQVSGDRIVWSRKPAHWPSPEIYTWTPQRGVVRLTRDRTYDYSPRVSGDRIVWQHGYRGGVGPVSTWTPATGIVRVTRGPLADDRLGGVDGDRVMWVRHAHDGTCTLFLWTPSRGAVAVSGNVSEEDDPRMSGARLVWVGMDAAREWAIYTWTSADGTRRLTGGSDSGGATVSGDRVAWASGGSVRLWTPEPAAGRSYSYVLDGVDGTLPDEVAEGTETSAALSGVADGIWYFHVRARDASGVWGPPAQRVIRVDTTRPTTAAPASATAFHGGVAVLTFELHDAVPNGRLARVTIRIRDAQGHTVKTLDRRKYVNRVHTVKFRCDLPRGTYRFFVYATDSAGNAQANVAWSTLRVR